MKAEHRKELETNILADRMGKLVQRMKTRPQKRVVVYVVLAIILVVAGYGLYLYWRTPPATNELWIALDTGDRNYLFQLAKEPEWSNPKKAARFQIAHFYFWDEGLRRLGLNTAEALDYILISRGLYEDLATECKGDPYWEPEAAYSLAAIEETLAMTLSDRSKINKQLESARRKYDEVATNFKESGYGKMAEKRSKELKDPALTAFYVTANEKFKIAENEKLRQAMRKLQEIKKGKQ